MLLRQARLWSTRQASLVSLQLEDHCIKQPRENPKLVPRLQ